ncbi:hypothetical protein [Streptomyces exfoliatus]|uniref:hypothetical protein n=1 Tax=Streptomyces exfoliatus TaxID=1905 RepID=UPI0006910A85|nr:hypothetical protein [Streptomyces exfoliatus]
MKSTKIAALVTAWGILTLSGCGGASGGGAEEISTIGTDPKIIVHDLSVAPGMTLKGRLASPPDGSCLVVTGERAGEKFTASPLWPKGAEPTLSDGRRGVSVPGFGTISEGDSIVAAGSHWEAGDKRTEGVGMNAPCLAEDGFIVFNRDSFQS